ncbi:MAG: 5-formyltetrahydrofolate cyclo-ligase, partial [Alphaproteobacteria bacterium]|nr:5-formyltetrahydrofolate cyclo-ligase [Alphaproteobacteria bacterium]
MSVEKARLRKIFKARRAELNQGEVRARSQKICKNFLHNILPKVAARNFSLYLASGNEARTDMLAEHFRKNNISFSYPKIIAKDQPLEFVMSAPETGFKPSKFFPEILEPDAGEKVLPDVLVLPLLAFDSYLSRLGMGGGFFDRTVDFLRKQNPRLIAIGLAFDFQRFEEILPIDNTDQRLDFVVTEKDIFLPSQYWRGLRVNKI